MGLNATPPPCNLCGHLESRVLLDAPKRVHAPQHRVVYRCCRRCSFVFLDLDYAQWLPTYEQDMAERSPAELSAYSDQEEKETAAVLQDLGRVEPSLLEGCSRKVADIGAGAGGSLRVFQSLGWQAVGIETARCPALHARETLGLDMRNERYTPHSFSESSLDWIYCYHTLEHLPRPYQTLTHFRRHLKPGGLLYVEVPDVRDVNVYHMGFGHISMFTKPLLEQTLATCGFQLLHTLDRSHAPSSFGPGFLCCKTGSASEAPEAEFLSINGGWRKDAALDLKWRLWFGFHAGRGREAVSWKAPLRLARAGLKYALGRRPCPA